MTGMTPAWLTFSGRYVDVSPYWRRPTMRLAYWTGMRRWPCSMKITATTRMSTPTTTAENTTPPEFRRICIPWPGMCVAMPAKMSSDMPLPMPRSVMSSPNHMTSTAPAVMTTTIETRPSTPTPSLRTCTPEPRS